MATLQIDSERCSKVLRPLLVGAYIDKISYFVTGWNLRFMHASNGETMIYVADLTTADASRLRDFFGNSPIDLTGNDPEDTVTATVLFGVVNSFQVVNVDVAEAGNVNLEFSNGQRLTAAGEADGTDISWEATLPGKVIISCSFGETFRST